MSKAVKPEAPQKVDYNDAVAESKKYFDGDDLAAMVWVSKYALKDSFGNIYETSPRQMHERIAAEIERIERKYPNPSATPRAASPRRTRAKTLPRGRRSVRRIRNTPRSNSQTTLRRSAAGVTATPRTF